MLYGISLIRDILDEYGVLILFSMWIFLVIYISMLVYNVYKQNNHKQIRERWNHRSLH